LEIKGTEDGNVEEEAVVNFRAYMDGLAAEELEVDLILWGDEGMECTYSQGYKNWQAGFACQTCTPDGNAGFCTACSLSCHEVHDVCYVSLVLLTAYVLCGFQM
jgi:E3 ubiquitin-protein ligase UBR7